jgi:hypothetical protein
VTSMRRLISRSALMPLAILLAASCKREAPTLPVTATPTDSVVTPPAPRPVVAIGLNAGQVGISLALTTGVQVSVQATPEDADGKPVVDTATAVWSSSNPAAATVASSGPLIGQVTAVGPGSTTITVKLGAVTAAMPVAVEGVGAVATIVLRPSGMNFVADVQQGFGPPAPLFASLSDTLARSVRALVNWSSSNPSAATVSSDGFVTPNPDVPTSAFTTITATAGSASAALKVFVNPPVGAVVVTPTAYTLSVGQSIVLRATTQDLGGGALIGVPIFWNPSSGFMHFSAQGMTDAGVDTVVVTADAAGFTQVSAIEPVSHSFINLTLNITSATAELSQAGSGDQGGAQPFDPRGQHFKIRPNTSVIGARNADDVAPRDP